MPNELTHWLLKRCRSRSLFHQGITAFMESPLVLGTLDFGLKDTNKIQCLLDPLLLWTMADFNICTAFSHFRGPVNTRPVMVTHGSKDQTIPTSTITSLRLSKRWYGQQRVLFGSCHVSYSLHNFLSIPCPGVRLRLWKLGGLGTEVLSCQQH